MYGVRLGILRELSGSELSERQNELCDRLGGQQSELCALIGGYVDRYCDAGGSAGLNNRLLLTVLAVDGHFFVAADTSDMSCRRSAEAVCLHMSAESGYNALRRAVVSVNGGDE